MNKRLVVLFLLLTSNQCISQVTSNLIIFSEDDKQFTLRINGIESSSIPKSNVRVDGIQGATYRIRMAFADTSLGALNETITIKSGYENTYAIRLKKVSAFEKKMKKIGNNVAWNFDMKDSAQMAERRAEIENQNSRFVIVIQSSVALTSAEKYSTGSTVIQSEKSTSTGFNKTNEGSQPTVNAAETKTTNTTTTTKSPNVSLNINIGGNGSRSDDNFTEETTDVRSSSSNPGYVPGYKGPYGCSMPMANSEFQSAKYSIQSKDFEQTKLTISKQVFDHNCLLSSQVKEIILLFTFEKTKLDFAKYAYCRTYDIGNYYKVNDAFQFESSVDELNRFIESK